MSQTQQSKIITALKMQPYITSRDMINMGIFKYSSRIAELRKRGYEIKATRISKSLWKYELIEPDRPSQTTSALKQNKLFEVGTRQQWL